MAKKLPDDAPRYRALGRNVPVSPQKGRLVADLIRNMPVAVALERLRFSKKKAGAVVMKVLNSAIANAEENHQADIDNLKVSKIEVLEGISMRRAQFGARGRVGVIRRRRSHVALELSEVGGKREE